MRIRTALLLFLIGSSLCAEERYVPFPVVFVHGIASSGHRWAQEKNTRDQLDDFFMDKYGYEATEAWRPPVGIEKGNQAVPTEYFPLVNYENDAINPVTNKPEPDTNNNGDIVKIARFHLEPALRKALRTYARKIGIPDTVALADLPADKVKLNLVCHSMGGLVLRSLLKQEADGKFAPLPNDFYTSHIHRVVFIGTPHLGSPLASFSEREARG